MSTACIRRSFTFTLDWRARWRAFWSGTFTLVLHEHARKHRIDVVSVGVDVPDDPPCVSLEVH